MMKLRVKAAAMLLAAAVLLLPGCGMMNGTTKQDVQTDRSVTGTKSTDEVGNTAEGTGENRTGVQNDGNGVAEGANDIVNGAANGTKDVVNGAVDGVRDAADGVVNGVKDAADGVADSMNNNR